MNTYNIHRKSTYDTAEFSSVLETYDIDRGILNISDVPTEKNKWVDRDIDSGTKIHVISLDKHALSQFETAADTNTLVHVISGGVLVDDQEIFDQDSIEIVGEGIISFSAEEEHTVLVLIEG